MKFSIIYAITVTYLILLWEKCVGLEITAEEFSWKLMENSLNSSKTTDNFVVAPYEAYHLYKNIFHIKKEEEEAEVSKEGYDRESLSTLLPAIRKQQNTVSSKRTNQTDLLSSVSLTTRWAFNFQTRDTHKRIFYQQGKANQKMLVDFLRKDDTFYYAHDDQLNASILELPLNVKKIKLIIILPDHRAGLQQLKDYLLENVNELSDLVNKTNKMVLVRVLLPKFRLMYKKDLTGFFEEISSQEVEDYANVYQQSDLEFNERGIGRFERTTVLFWNSYSYLRVAPELFDINHPFLFLITNKDGIQFFGQVVKMQPS